jgi:hypothetical protein
MGTGSIVSRLVVRPNIMAGGYWWSKATHFMVTSKQKRENGRDRGPDIPFKGILPTTSFLQ